MCGVPWSMFDPNEWHVSPHTCKTCCMKRKTFGYLVDVIDELIDMGISEGSHYNATRKNSHSLHVEGELIDVPRPSRDEMLAALDDPKFREFLVPVLRTRLSKAWDDIEEYEQKHPECN